MAKQTFTTGQVLTAAQMTSLQQTAMFGGSASAKTASYTLVAADAGTAISMTSASSTTITVNTSLFSAGDIVTIVNLGAGTCTVTAGTATVNTAGSLALNQYDGGVLYFTSASAAIFLEFTQSASSPFAGCLLTKSANQTISNATNTAITFDLERLDTDAYHSTVTNTSRITIPSGKGGKYLINIRSAISANASGYRIHYLYKNGVSVEAAYLAPSNVDTNGFSNTTILDLVATDYIEVFYRQNSGTSLTLYSDAYDPGVTQFSAYLIGA